ncbi:hypothetical protein [Neomegalonema perideroedes]|uniref:hypothetical protein n=1 Tax=Neomegalonema perideroedes TaxID=217219 RepID=UPI0003751191|nr:hypothetical protein [Neomegalonema perideroedes]
MPNRVFVFSTPRAPRGILATVGALALGAVLIATAVVASAALLVIGGGAALALGLWAKFKGGAQTSETREEAGPFARPDGVIEGVRYAEVRVEDRRRQPPR